MEMKLFPLSAVSTRFPGSFFNLASSMMERSIFDVDVGGVT
jgi:hypothetical protein